MKLLSTLLLSLQLSSYLLHTDSTPDGPGVCFGTGYPNDLSLFASQHGASADTFNQAVTVSIGNGGSSQLQVGCSYQVSVCTHSQQYTGFIAYFRKQSDHSHSPGLALHGSSTGHGQQFSCDSDDGSATVAHNEPSWKGPNLEVLYTPPTDADLSTPVIFDVILVTGSDQNSAASDPWVLTSSSIAYTLVAAGTTQCPTVTSNTLCEDSSSSSIVSVATVDPMAGMDMGSGSMDMGSGSMDIGSSATTAASSSSATSSSNGTSSSSAASSSSSSGAMSGDMSSMPMSSSNNALTANSTMAGMTIIPSNSMMRSDIISIAALCISVSTLLVVLYICINAPLRHYTLKDIIRHSFPVHHSHSNRSLSTAYQPLTTPAASTNSAADADNEDSSKEANHSAYTEHATIAALPSQDTVRSHSIYSD